MSISLKEYRDLAYRDLLKMLGVEGTCLIWKQKLTRLILELELETREILESPG